MEMHCRFPRSVSISRGRLRIAWPGLLHVSIGLVLASASLAGDARTGERLQADFEAYATIDAEGDASIGTLSGVNEKLAEGIRAQLAAQSYVPATREGVPVKSEAFLSGTVVLTPVEDDRYSLALENLSLLPIATKILKAAPPRYPPEMYRRSLGGSVEMRLTIGADGRVSSTHIVSATNSWFEKAVRDSLGGWKFAGDPEGEKVEVALPVVFRLDSRKELESETIFECAAMPEQARIEGQKSCLARIEVTAKPSP